MIYTSGDFRQMQAHTLQKCGQQLWRLDLLGAFEMWSSMEAVSNLLT